MRGFSLIEVLITLCLIGIIASLLIPSLSQAQAEATRQVVRNQVKVLETALANWYANQPSLQTASTLWDANCSLSGGKSTGYINSNGFSAGTLLPSLRSYLDSNNNFTAYQQTSGDGYIDTPQMQQVIADGVKNTSTFIKGGYTDVSTALTTTHTRLYWDPNNRTTTSPKVVLFMPAYNQ
jgi:prepilin-type N-terminal cleavage/methylation domain-containing protein